MTAIKIFVKKFVALRLLCIPVHCDQRLEEFVLHKSTHFLSHIQMYMYTVPVISGIVHIRDHYVVQLHCFNFH